MKTRSQLLVLVAMATLSACLTGCLSTYYAQLQKQIPKVDAESITVSGHTIYGVSGDLTETGVVWTGDTKEVATSHARVDSPVGSFVVDVKKGKIRP